MPQQRHVAKTMPLQHFGGARDLFQTKFFFIGMFFKLFFLQGRKSYLSLLSNCILLEESVASLF